MPSQGEPKGPSKAETPRADREGKAAGIGLTLYASAPTSSPYTEPLISTSDFKITHKSFGGTAGGSVKVDEDGDISVAIEFFRLDSKHGLGLTLGARIKEDFGQAGGFDFQIAGGEIYHKGNWALGPKIAATVKLGDQRYKLFELQAQSTRDVTLKLGVRMLGYGHQMTIEMDTVRIYERLGARFHSAMVNWGVPTLP